MSEALAEEEEAYYKGLGARVRMLRDHHDLSQQEIADYVGLSRGSVANLEAGRQRPDLYRTCLLAKALGVRPAVLMTGEVDLDEAQPTPVPRIERTAPAGRSRRDPDVPTEREIAVLKGLCEGMSHSEIARQQGVSRQRVYQVVQSLAERELLILVGSRPYILATLLGVQEGS